MNVCDNLGDHLVGNVYVKFKMEEDAEKAVNDLNNRWFGGRPIYAELTPITRKLRHELYGRSGNRGGGGGGGGHMSDNFRRGDGQIDLKDELEMEKRNRRDRGSRRDRSRERRRSRSR